jgi:hypothetical protein
MNRTLPEKDRQDRLNLTTVRKLWLSLHRPDRSSSAAERRGHGMSARLRQEQRSSDTR